MAPVTLAQSADTGVLIELPLGPGTPLAVAEPFLPVTTLLGVALLGLLIWLTMRIVRERQSNRVSLGSGGVESLERAARAHGNLAEFAPFGLILTGLAELQGAPWWLLAPTALAFFAGRVLHALAFTGPTMSFPRRAAGMKLTIFSLGGLAVTALGSLW